MLPSRERESKSRERGSNEISLLIFPKSCIYREKKSIQKNTICAPLHESDNPKLRFDGGSSSGLRIKCSKSLFHIFSKNVSNCTLRFRKILATHHNFSFWSDNVPRTSQTCTGHCVTPNYANIILIFRIFQLPSKPCQPRPLVHYRTKWCSGTPRFSLKFL